MHYSKTKTNKNRFLDLAGWLAAWLGPKSAGAARSMISFEFNQRLIGNRRKSARQIDFYRFSIKFWLETRGNLRWLARGRFLLIFKSFLIGNQRKSEMADPRQISFDFQSDSNWKSKEIWCGRPGAASHWLSINLYLQPEGNMVSLAQESVDKTSEASCFGCCRIVFQIIIINIKYFPCKSKRHPDSS